LQGDCALSIGKQGRATLCAVEVRISECQAIDGPDLKRVGDEGSKVCIRLPPRDDHISALVLSCDRLDWLWLLRSLDSHLWGEVAPAIEVLCSYPVLIELSFKDTSYRSEGSLSGLGAEAYEVLPLGSIGTLIPLQVVGEDR
jgi:hypothetical protein